MFISLDNNVFFRDFENFGYLYNQQSHHEMVVNKTASVFLASITRQPIDTSQAVVQICKSFPNAATSEIENDFIEFVQNLYKQGYINIKETKTINHNIQNDNYISCNINHLDVRNVLHQFLKNSPKPLFVHFEITNKCNLKCVHCYIPEKETRTFSPSLMLNILSELRRMGTVQVTFSGGEPFVDKNIFEYISYARRIDLSVGIMTNGTLIDSDTIEFLSMENLSFIQISLYSMDPTIHDTITGIRGSWNLTKLCIDKILRAGISLTIACPVLKENLDSFEKVGEFCKANGIRWGNDLDIYAKTDFSRDNLQHRLEACEIVKAVSIISKLRRNQLDNKHNPPNPDSPVCSMGIQQLSISYDGNVYPCPCFQLAVGNVYNMSISQIWNTSESLKRIQCISYKDYPSCITCDYTAFCKLCPAYLFCESSGNFLSMDSYFCEIAKARRNISLL